MWLKVLNLHYVKYSTEETFYQDILEILKHPLQNFLKILKKCMMRTNIDCTSISPIDRLLSQSKYLSKIEAKSMKIITTFKIEN